MFLWFRPSLLQPPVPCCLFKPVLLVCAPIPQSISMDCCYKHLLHMVFAPARQIVYKLSNSCRKKLKKFDQPLAAHMEDSQLELHLHMQLQFSNPFHFEGRKIFLADNSLSKCQNVAAQTKSQIGPIGGTEGGHNYCSGCQVIIQLLL